MVKQVAGFNHSAGSVNTVMEAVRKAVVERHPRDRFTIATKFPTFDLKTEEEIEPIFARQPHPPDGLPTQPPPGTPRSCLSYSRWAEDCRLIQECSYCLSLFLQLKGYTYFDTSYVYHNGKSEEAVRKAVVERHPRDRFTIATKFPIYFRFSLKKRSSLSKGMMAIRS